MNYKDNCNMKNIFISLAMLLICTSSHGQILGFYPQVDTLFTAGGCTPTQIITSYVKGMNDIDTLKIIPDWNTWFWSDKDIFYGYAYFLIIDSLEQYESELWMKPVQDYELPVLIPTDSVVWFDAREYYFQLILKEQGRKIDSLSQFCKARIGIGIKSRDQNSSNFYLGNFPNPFNLMTTIQYSISIYGNAQISVYNTRGQLVEEWVNAVHSPGKYAIKWQTGELASGQYYIILRKEQMLECVKCLLLK